MLAAPLTMYVFYCIRDPLLYKKIYANIAAMLLVLMYHQILNPEKPDTSIAFKEHLCYLKDNYPIILPGDNLIKNTLNICLTFDDAYFDFYYYVFPLLQQLKIPAILSIPTQFIQETTTITSKERLAIHYPAGLAQSKQKKTPLCTWKELKEMVDSSFVQAASHSHNHVNLTNPDININEELQKSKFMLEQTLQTKINTFVYPFGKNSLHTNKLAMQHYKYVMKIGSALNMDWHARDGLIYRINADSLWQKNKYITSGWVKKAQLKYWFNYIRKK